MDVDSDSSADSLVHLYSNGFTEEKEAPVLVIDSERVKPNSSNISHRQITYAMEDSEDDNVIPETPSPVFNKYMKKIKKNGQSARLKIPIQSCLNKVNANDRESCIGHIPRASSSSAAAAKVKSAHRIKTSGEKAKKSHRSKLKLHHMVLSSSDEGLDPSSLASSYNGLHEPILAGNLTRSSRQTVHSEPQMSIATSTVTKGHANEADNNGMQGDTDDSSDIEESTWENFMRGINNDGSEMKKQTASESAHSKVSGTCESAHLKGSGICESVHSKGSGPCESVHSKGSVTCESPDNNGSCACGKQSSLPKNALMHEQNEKNASHMQCSNVRRSLETFCRHFRKSNPGSNHCLSPRRKKRSRHLSPKTETTTLAVKSSKRKSSPPMSNEDFVKTCQLMNESGPNRTVAITRNGRLKAKVLSPSDVPMVCGSLNATPGTSFQRVENQELRDALLLGPEEDITLHDTDFNMDMNTGHSGFTPTLLPSATTRHLPEYSATSTLEESDSTPRTANLKKKMSQIDEDEAMARRLQEESDREFAASLEENRQIPKFSFADGELTMALTRSSEMAEGRPSAPPPHQHQQHMQFLNVMQDNGIDPLLAGDDINTSPPMPEPTRPVRLRGNRFSTRRSTTTTQHTSTSPHRGINERSPVRMYSRRRPSAGRRRPAAPPAPPPPPPHNDFPEGYAADLQHMIGSFGFILDQSARSRRRGRQRGLPAALGAALLLTPTQDEGNDYDELWAISEMLGDAVPRGLSAEQISRLPNKRHRVDRTRPTSEECPVCMCDFQEGDHLRILPCFHDYHTSCIDKWLQDNATCPVCRVPVEV